MKTLSAIPIKSPYIDMILIGVKTWEIRSKSTKKIGPVALIKSGSGTVVATAYLSEDIFLTRKICLENAGEMAMVKEDAVRCVGGHAWVLNDLVKLNKPVPYKHPPGAITWVTLDEATTKKVLKEASKSPKVF